jgi:hypothetical protein
VRRLFVLRRTHETAVATHQQAAVKAARQAEALRELLAVHIVAAEHPSSEASSAAAMATALREDLQSRGIDLTRELARHEGSTP